MTSRSGVCGVYYLAVILRVGKCFIETLDGVNLLDYFFTLVMVYKYYTYCIC